MHTALPLLNSKDDVHNVFAVSSKVAWKAL
jgi:hypothetical protein